MTTSKQRSLKELAALQRNRYDWGYHALTGTKKYHVWILKNQQSVLRHTFHPHTEGYTDLKTWAEARIKEFKLKDLLCG